MSEIKRDEWYEIKLALSDGRHHLIEQVYKDGKVRTWVDGREIKHCDCSGSAQ